MKSIPFLNLEFELRDFTQNYNKESINRIKAKKLVEAAKDFGFVQLVGHGIPTSELIDLMNLTRDFFSDVEMTSSCKIDENYRGFIGLGNMRMRYSTHPDNKESFIFGLEDNECNRTPIKNNWPLKNSLLRNHCIKMLKKFNNLGFVVLQYIAAGLDLEVDTFTKRFNPPLTRGSLLRYPPNVLEHKNKQSDFFGVAPHTDYGCITIVYQHEIGGLQINLDGQWIDIPSHPEALIINIGDLMSRWVNDYLVSTVHRVINPSYEYDRYSFAVFIDPSPDETIDCISLDGAVQKYQPINAAKYIAERQNEGISK
ncbi:2OG-Fe(II) oxygenase family protein [Acidithiobacillus thiooxidans]|uniref:isopenicillin N synthase family dioxygenase n=1 Tax=Acidithiobacillus thiooxidans TaxID=930 RepID=UPI002864ACBA|nr:2OG-Fe(II) oxygenase family protein [Acidithiobacillus thiooxidans]MDR7925789.1 2OG-Fe(II) oxygenase family protein [Acidithiobacillus thiooxidans]